MVDPVVVSVDLGFAKKGRNYAADMDMPIAFIEKRRHGNDANAEALTLIGEVKDRDVIIVEDIVDTGLTLHYLQEILQARGPRSLRTACLLNKPSRRKIDVKVDYIGFTIEDRFVIGYGLDYAERYRNLPYIGVLDY